MICFLVDFYLCLPYSFRSNTKLLQIILSGIPTGYLLKYMYSASVECLWHKMLQNRISNIYYIWKVTRSILKQNKMEKWQEEWQYKHLLNSISTYERRQMKNDTKNISWFVIFPSPSVRNVLKNIFLNVNLNNNIVRYITEFVMKTNNQFWVYPFAWN